MPGGGEEVRPSGQSTFGAQSALRALQAFAVITSVTVVGGATTLTFDPDQPNSKYISAGLNLTVPNAFGPGTSLTLMPLLIPDPDFPAHANCAT